MGERDWVTYSAEDTIRTGRELGARLKPPALILLRGELGAGKTTLTKGIVSGLGAAREEEVTSPTFTLVHNYHNGVRVYHIDLYRVGDFRDFETLGVEDLFTTPAIVIVEWPERMTLRSGWPVVQIELEHVDENSRRIRISDADNVLGGI
jgi:tRNA threonylcarbamoyladenosine biosynthesis protein TsaE